MIVEFRGSGLNFETFLCFFSSSKYLIVTILISDPDGLLAMPCQQEIAWLISEIYTLGRFWWIMAVDVCLTTGFVGTSLKTFVIFSGEKQEAINLLGVLKEIEINSRSWW